MRGSNPALASAFWVALEEIGSLSTRIATNLDSGGSGLAPESRASKPRTSTARARVRKLDGVAWFGFLRNAFKNGPTAAPRKAMRRIPPAVAHLASAPVPVLAAP